LKVETDIITSITASPTGWAMILVIMYVEIFKTGVIVFICDIKICLTSHWPIIFNIRVRSCTWELQPDLILLQIKASSVNQTLSAAHIKRKMSNLPIFSSINHTVDTDTITLWNQRKNVKLKNTNEDKEIHRF
jgi:hypothetical protein